MPLDVSCVLVCLRFLSQLDIERLWVWFQSCFCWDKCEFGYDEGKLGVDLHQAAASVDGVVLHAIPFDLPIITIGFTISDFVAKPVSSIVFPAESSLAHRHTSLLLLMTWERIIFSHDQCLCLTNWASSSTEQPKSSNDRKTNKQVINGPIVHPGDLHLLICFYELVLS